MVRRIKTSKLDPCMMIGFLLQTEGDADRFFGMVERLSRLGTFVFNVAEKAPQYKDDLDFGKVSDAEWS